MVGRPGMRLVVLRGSLAALVFAIALPVFGQRPTGGAADLVREFVHESWSVRDDLPAANFFTVLQGRDGYLWFATDHGLVRFDGVRMTLFEPQPASATADQGVTAITEGRDGGLWVGTSAGMVARFDGSRFGDWVKTGGNRVAAVMEDGAGAVWAGTNLGVCRVEGHTCTTWPGSAGMFVRTMGLDARGQLYVGGRGLFRRTATGFETLSILPTPNAAVSHISWDRTGTMWLATSEGVLRVVLAREPGGAPQVTTLDTRDGLPSKYALTVVPGAGDDLWIGTLGGGIAVRRQGRVMSMNLVDGLSDSRVNRIALDAEGRVWAATSGGLDRFSPRACITYGRQDGLPDPLVWTVEGNASGDIWLSTDAGGITRFVGGHFTTWHLPGPRVRQEVGAVVPMRDGSLLITLVQGGVVRFRNGRFDDLSVLPGAPTGRVRKIVERANGEAYLAGAQGLFRFKDGAFTRIDLPGAGGDVGLNTMTLAPDGSLWAIGSALYHVRETRAERVATLAQLGLGSVSALMAEADRLWLSPAHGGLHLREASGRVSALAGANPDLLSDAFVVVDDHRGYVWLASTFGLQRVPKQGLLDFAAGRAKTVQVDRFDKNDGLLSTEFNSSGGSSAWLAPDGRLWLAGAYGLVQVDPARLAPRHAALHVRVETVRAAGRAHPLAGGATVQKGEPIEIDFTALGLHAPRRARFRYRLSGFDEQWVESGTRRTAYYTNLPGGTYQFEVTVTTDAGLWSTGAATLPLRIVPPFYETLTFLSFATLGIVAAAVVLLDWRGRALRRRARLLEQQVTERTRALQEQMASRQEAEEALRRAHDDLEVSVAARTRELARANEALSLSQDRLRLLVQQLPAVLWSTDASLVCTSLMGSGLTPLGLQPDVIVGRSLSEFAAALDPAHWAIDAHRRALAGESQTREDRLGGRVYDWRLEPLRDGAGAITGTVGLALDVTDQTRLQEQFLQAQKMEGIGRLAGGVAHDLNNILTAVLGFVDLGEASRDASELRGNLEEIRQAAERAASLTRQLLAFARRQPTTPRTLDLNAVLSNLEPMLRRLIGEDVELSITCGGPACVVRADAGNLEQVIVNLVVNGRDAMPQGGGLTIECAALTLAGDRAAELEVPFGDYVRLTVRDTGCGMPEEVRRHAFEPFFTTKGQGQGTGLGLATCFGIVRQAGGSITIDSVVGYGTAVMVYLPRAHGALDQQTEAAGTPMPRGAETVLVAEDEPQVRHLVRSALERCGYRVLEAVDGEDALEVAAAHGGRIDLLLSDVVMPRMGGPELARRLSVVRPGTRLLFMSGYAEQTLLDEAARAGAGQPIAKPFRVNALADRVREALDGMH
jgi:signal transduction histidine kinase/ligand-binding sensor domain-containing protein/ActR/RegA family two-component response regulator